MKGELVLVRAFGGEPFEGRIYSEGERGVRVARADANLNAPDVSAAGVPWGDVFRHDPRLKKQLRAASDAGDATQLSLLWEKATPLHSN